MTSPVDDLSLEDSLGAAYNLPRRWSGPLRDHETILISFPSNQGGTQREQLLLTGNHLIVAVLMRLGDVYV